MADRILLESGSPDGYLLEDGSGVVLIEALETSIAWNPSDAATWSGGLQFSTTNATNDTVDAPIALTGADSAVRTRTAIGRENAKVFFSIVAVQIGTGNHKHGFGDGSQDLTSVFGGGNHLNRAVVIDKNGDLYESGSYAGVTFSVSLSTALRTDWAIDPVNNLYWARTAGSNWNNSGTADPATSVGGRAIPSSVVGALYPSVLLNPGGSSGQNSTARVDTLTNTTANAPSGFTALGAAGASSVTGTGALTDANDTASATGSVDVSGSLGRTEANDTASGTGASTVTGTVASTEANDTTALSGSVSVTGAFSSTEASDTASGTGSVSVSGSAASTEANDTASASGTVGTVPITGTASSTEANDTASLSGSVVVSGSLARTEANDTASASGSVGSSAITGTASLTEANDSVAIVASALIAGSISISEIADIASGTGTATQPDIVPPSRPRRRRLKIVDYGMILTRPERR